MKKIIGIGFLICMFGLVDGARIFFQAIESTFPSNCPIGVDIMLDTQGINTIGTELIFGFNKDEIFIHGIVDGGTYQMPIGSKYFDNLFYFSTTNLGTEYFNGFGKIGSLIIESKNKTKSTIIKIINEVGKTNDSNVVSDQFNDILNQTVDGNYYFDSSLKCENKLSDFNIFKEPDISNLTNDEAIKVLEDEIIKTQKKYENKSNNKINYYILTALLILLILLTFIMKKSKNKKNENS